MVVKKLSKMSWNRQMWLRLDWDLAKIDPNASRKPLEALQGPGDGIFIQKWAKRTKTGQTEKFHISLPIKLPINRFGRPLVYSHDEACQAMGGAKLGGLVDDENGVRWIGSILGYVSIWLEVKLWQHMAKMGLGLRWRAQIWSIWIENELIKRFKTLPGPGEAQKNQKLSK